MNKKTNKYIYEFAKENNGVELKNLLETSSFNGDYELIYTKRPNAYNSVSKDSENFAIAIGKNKITNEICGMGICSINKMLVDGKGENIAYLSGFRRKSNVGGNIIEMYRMLGDFCRNNIVKYTFTTILESNIHVRNMLTKKRKSMPDYIKIADYTVNIFKSKLKKTKKYFCNKAVESDLENLKDFIKTESRGKLFFPNIDLDNGFFGLNYKDFYLLKNSDEEILACGILWNQTDYKQLIVKKYSLTYKLIKIAANFILKIFNFPVLPEVNQIIDYSTLSFVLYKNDNEEYLHNFIGEISYQVKEKMFVYGSTKALSKKITPMKYKSFVYIVDWDKNFNENDFKNKNIYIECGLL